ncbi:MAG: tagaturonate reductase [Clostridia bacterium]|nr:tagaturonate reductase [Clostridia bacterium]
MKETVIQFGEGNFLRGFFDYFLHNLNKKGLYEGKAVVVQPIAMGRAEELNDCDCKYNLYLRGIQNGEIIKEHTFVESISRCIDPYKSYEDYMALADNPDFRFIVSNTTEAGIEFVESCKLEDKPALSFPGKLTQLLYRRYKNNLKGFVILACELIDNNGTELKKCVMKYADLWNLGDDFKAWLESENHFINTLVDRIVTGYPNDETKDIHPDDKFLDTAEIFHLWVIEGDFEDEFPLKKAGFNVIWTDDAKPYKKTKVRILNGSHTTLVAGALLMGIETVGDAMNNELTNKFLDHCLQNEILPTIGASESNIAFAGSVLDRFRNPFIQHKWRSIVLNCVSKFAVRVLPTLLEYKQQNGSYPKGLSMALAYLIRFYKQDEPVDAQDVIEAMKNDSIADILANTALWQADLSDMTDMITEYYNKIDELGAKGAMEWILSE